jgi:hypothetical protein
MIAAGLLQDSRNFLGHFGVPITNKGEQRYVSRSALRLSALDHLNEHKHTPLSLGRKINFACSKRPSRLQIVRNLAQEKIHNSRCATLAISLLMEVAIGYS